jgi:hypothetical protein
MELTVQILSFGSAWWVRPGWDEQDSQRYTRHAAYFNSTGVMAGSKIHMAGPVRGLVRFNISSGLDLHSDETNVGRVFCFAEMHKYRETNRLLALRRSTRDAKPTHWLVKLDSALHGTISLSGRWNTGEVQMVAMSRYQGRQESLLLITLNAQIPTTLGLWRLHHSGHQLPRLMLMEETELLKPGRNRHEISQGFDRHQ